jgi:hypothetical protein
MNTMRSRLHALALAALLSGCASMGPQSFGPGTGMAAVMQRMGAPTGEYALPSGGRRLEYSRGPFGKTTDMFDFDAAGQLVRSEQVLTEARFNAIRAGMGAQEVLSQIGRPSKIWGIPRQRQNVWSYRYDTTFCQWFMVGMGYDDKVVDTAYGPDPWCDDDDFFRRLRVR